MDSKLAGKRLRLLRGNRTREKVANDLHISASALRSYENGDRRPRDEVKDKIALYYGKTVQEIFFS